MSKKIFEPAYKVHFNRATGARAVTVGKRVVTIHTVKQGSRNYYTHYAKGSQSQLFPTLRDCIVDVVY